MKDYQKRQDCPECDGTGEQYAGWPTDPAAYRECTLCQGCGTIDRPTHPNLAADTAYYRARRARKLAAGRSRSAHILDILDGAK